MIVFEFKLHEFDIGSSLFFEIAERGDTSVFKDDDLFAAFLNVAQKMRGDHDVNLAGIANLFNELNHAASRCGIKAVGRLVKEKMLWSMHNGLRQLGELLHAERRNPQFSITDFPQSHAE